MEFSSLINSTLDSVEVRKLGVEAAVALSGAETGSLLLVDRETGDLFFEVALGEKGEQLRKIRLSRGQGIAGWVAQTGESLIINDAPSDPRFFRGVDEKSSFITRNLICVPVRTKDKVIGALETVNKRNGMFDEEDREILFALANHMAIAIENAHLYNELKEAFYGIAHALAEIIEKRDPYTGGHTQRVMRYCLAIGERMGLTEKEIEDLRLAAILHDIGKIGVRDSILLKRGGLSAEEQEIMSRHTGLGAEILSHVKQLKGAIPGVRGHHEKYDGTGYPDHLRGEDIPCIARIIAIADTFDAMTTDRPYRKAMDIHIALDELRKDSWSKYDGRIVENFIHHFMENGEPGDT
jgi:HD-GYP domain-containing protein (c-di-GMP phosphodiesterase class II)